MIGQVSDSNPEYTNGVVFDDIDNNNHENSIHHCRSLIIKEESKHLDKIHNSDTSDIIYFKTLKHVFKWSTTQKN